MVVKVRRNNCAVRIISRMLHRTELVNVVRLRYNDNAARVLARGAFYARTAERNALELRVVRNDRAFLKVFFFA